MAVPRFGGGHPNGTPTSDSSRPEKVGPYPWAKLARGVAGEAFRSARRALPPLVLGRNGGERKVGVDLFDYHRAIAAGIFCLVESGIGRAEQLLCIPARIGE